MNKALFQWIDRATALLLVGALLASLIFKQLSLTTSILLGGGLAWINFWLLRTVIMGLVLKTASKKRLIGLLMFKYLGVIIVLMGMLIYFNLHAGGLLIGVSTLVVAVLLHSLRQLWNTDLHGTE
jgi:hypothetical protein